MSYDNPSDFEIDARKMLERMDKEIASLTCLVSGLCQQVRAAGGEEAVAVAVEAAITEARSMILTGGIESDIALIKAVAEGKSIKR
ncbi:hypothetical protein [Pseudomonas cremoricolorata]|uniref:Prophage PssSM-02 n=1 Tax=Pseudomonas cremoricolorata TaxID=157783 RepID=A0A089WMJ3_9PSED|nr:hypothetical protein [Pseudomonas cremoricolorata]AIR90530.1 hypothetical protein LK03_15100 [Pseudomonas cremoricolorata]